MSDRKVLFRPSDRMIELMEARTEHMYGHTYRFTGPATDEERALTDAAFVYEDGTVATEEDRHRATGADIQCSFERALDSLSTENL